jgi:hypothetical protein
MLKNTASAVFFAHLAGRVFLNTPHPPGGQLGVSGWTTFEKILHCSTHFYNASKFEGEPSGISPYNPRDKYTPVLSCPILNLESILKTKIRNSFGDFSFALTFSLL